MDYIIRGARDNFNKDKKKEPSINIGGSGFLTLVCVSFHFTLAIIVSSHNLVGPPLKCHDVHPQEEDICASNLYYLEIGTADATKSFAFYKVSHWVFVAIGLAALAIQYLWTALEAGVVARLCGDFVGTARSEEDSDKQANIIARHLDRFDLHHPCYHFFYIGCEVLRVLFSTSIFLYYHALLNLQKVGTLGLLQNFFQPNVGIDSRVMQQDPVVKLFPREIACPYEFIAATGELASQVVRCKVTNQDYVELFHIILYLVSLFVMTASLLNSIYIIIRIRYFASIIPRDQKLSRSDKKGLTGLTLRKRLVLFLLYINLDRWTHEMIMKKVLRMKTRVEVKSRSGSRSSRDSSEYL